MAALPAQPQRQSSTLGLASDVKPINVLGYLVSSFVSVSSLVFVSASTSFVLTTVLRLPVDRLGRMNGSLVLLDELVALPAVMIWGRLADVYGYRAVTVIGHFIVAVSLSVFVQSKVEYQLFLSRVPITIGFAALTTMLSTILASMTAARSQQVIPQECEASANNEGERTALLSMPKKRVQLISQRSARLSGLIGFTSGLGALFGVFFLLRLPLYFADHSASPPREALRAGVRASFFATSAIAAVTAFIMSFALCRRGERTWPLAVRKSISLTQWKESLRALTLGFVLSKRHRHLAVAYTAGFSARATTIAVSAYLPVFVNQYFISTGKCQLDSPDAPSDTVKEGCHAAFALASALTGTVQLSALLLSPLAGWIAGFYSQPSILVVSNALGAMGFFAIGCLPAPDHFLVWPICVLLGLAQIAGVVVSLSLCASCRWQIYHSAPVLARQTEQPLSSCPSNHSADGLLSCPSTQAADLLPLQQDISGAIAGVYSLCGGVGILVGSFGGMLSDWAPQAPFYLTGCIATLVSLACFAAGR